MRQEDSRPATEGSPRGELMLRLVAMPKDTNPSGDIFGGWIMALMDLAAGTAAIGVARSRVVTAAVSNLTFLQPVQVGDSVACYADLLAVGRTSMRFKIEAWVLRGRLGDRIKVTEAEFVLVAVDEHRRPVPVPPQAPVGTAPISGR